MDKKRPKRSGCVYLVNLTPSLECWSFALSRLHIWRASLLHTWGRLHTWQSAPFQAAQTNDKQWFVEETWLEVTTHLWGQKRWSLMFLESSAQRAQPILRSLLKWSLRREPSRSFSSILLLCCCLRNIQFTSLPVTYIHWGSLKHHDIWCRRFSVCKRFVLSSQLFHFHAHLYSGDQEKVWNQVWERRRDLSREDTFKDDDLSRNLIRSGYVGETCSSAAGLLNSQTFRSEKWKPNCWKNLDLYKIYITCNITCLLFVGTVLCNGSSQVMIISINIFGSKDKKIRCHQYQGLLSRSPWCKLLSSSYCCSVWLWALWFF